MKKDIKILAIESSCDETAAAVIGVGKNHPIILSNIVSSQIDLHAKTGGVVPEVASRAHMEAIIPVIAEAIIEAKISKQTDTCGVIPDLIRDPGLDSRLRGNDNKNIMSDLYSEAIKELQNNIDFIAVTAGPGLVGSLLVGFNAAKSLAYALDKPMIPVNHIEGHIYSAFGGIENPKSEYQITNQSQNPDSKKELTTDNRQLITMSEFPILALTVSGGHTSLTLMKDHGDYENIGQTLDDAAGEAFDKVAKLLGLGYPGGPIVSKYALQFREKSEIRNSKLETNSKSLPEVASQHAMQAGETRNSKQKNNNLTTCLPVGKVQQFNNSTIVFPRPVLNDGTFNFSFSGLKTAVLQHVLNIKKERNVSIADKEEICAAFEDSVVDVLTTKAMRAIHKFKPKTVILAGGVAANKQLRTILLTKVDQYNCQLPSTGCKLNLLIPPINLCGDNAAMIGLAAFYHIQKNNISSWDKAKVDSNLEL